MSPKIAQATLTFLARCDLKGAEVPAFNEVVQALLPLANPPEAAQVASNVS